MTGRLEMVVEKRKEDAAWRTEVRKDILTLQEGHAGIQRGLIANTEITEAIGKKVDALGELSELLELFKSVKGFFRVLATIGRWGRWTFKWLIRILVVIGPVLAFFHITAPEWLERLIKLEVR
jgi:hypothetical protein